MDNVKSSMPGMKTAIKNLSEAADAIESAASSAQPSFSPYASTSKSIHYAMTPSILVVVVNCL